MKALEKLNERAMSMSIAVVMTAKPGEAFVANTMHKLVVEPRLRREKCLLSRS